MALARRARARRPVVPAKTLRGYRRIYTRRTDAYFGGMMARIEPDYRAAIRPLVDQAATKADALESAVDVSLSRIDWDAETRTLSTATRPVYVQVGKEAFDLVSDEIGSAVSYDLNARPLKEVQSGIARRITQVSETSRDKIAAMTADGIRKGLSVEQIVRGVPPGTSNVRGPVPEFPGIRKLVDSWRSTGSGARGILGHGISPTSSRSYLIALTETANAFNAASTAAYKSSGLVDFVEVFDGAECGWTSHKDSDLAHGSIRTVDDAADHPISHPRCQRSFGAALDATEAAPSPFLGREVVPGATPGTNATQGLREALADNLAAAARLAEPEVTALLDRVRVEIGNAEFEGLDFRLKAQGRIAEKALTDELDLGISTRTAAAGINDSLRYTFNIADDVYSAGVRRTLAALQAEGVSILKVKNFWLDSGYQGINTVLRTRSGVRFELQFGTPAQARTKITSHKLYEEHRVLDPTSARAREIERQIHDLWRPLHETRPPGVEGLTFESLVSGRAPAPARRPSEEFDVFVDPDVVAARERYREASERVGTSNVELLRVYAAYTDAAVAARARIAARASSLSAAEAKIVKEDIERLMDEIRLELRKRTGPMLISRAEELAIRDLRTQLDELTTSLAEVKRALPLAERIESFESWSGRSLEDALGSPVFRETAESYRDFLRLLEVLEDELPGLRSRWSGRVLVGPIDSGASGAIDWSNTFKISRTEALMRPETWRFHVFLHEAFHTMLPLTPVQYAGRRGWEEGVVEMTTAVFERRMRRRLGLNDTPMGIFERNTGEVAGQTYYDFTGALETMRRALGLTQEEYYRRLISVPAPDRPGVIDAMTKEALKRVEPGSRVKERRYLKGVRQSLDRILNR